MNKTLKEKQKAPEFCLDGIDTDGSEKRFCLKDFKGKRVVLYFYPKDNTPGCTKEACDFRDKIEVFRRKGAVVLGVSPDSLDSHKKFKNKYMLPFPLLADSGSKIAKKYGAYGKKQVFGRTKEGIIRSTFIIGKDGRVEKAFYGVKVDGHIDNLLQQV